MPWAPRRPCGKVGCRELAAAGYSRCLEHQRAAWREDNASDRVRGHLSSIHQQLRRVVLAEEPACANPWCRQPDAPGTLDYRMPLSKGGQQERSNCQRLCKSCNAAKGAKSWEAFLSWSEQQARLQRRIP